MAGTRQAPTEESAAAEEAAPQARKADSGAHVAYTGGYGGYAAERIIRPAQWGQLGIKNAKTVSFNTKNGFRIPESEFTAAQLEYLYDTDGFFVKVDKDGNPYKDGK